MSLPTRPLTLTINGRRRGPIDVPEGMMMIDVLHEMLDLTGSRLGCGQGICHACVVIWDRDDQTSEEVPTCITGADFFDGKRIRTIEGAAQTNDNGEIIALSAVQQAFLDRFSFQCGYCTPGFVNAATVLIERLKRVPVPRAELEATITAALENHICRCTGYVRYYQAVRDVILATPGLTRECVTGRRSASLLAAAAGAVAFATLVATSFLNGKADDRLQAADAQPDLVARGKYLAEAADCAACHSAPGGAPFAGGLPMQSGFGTIYATNITPDADDGIGRWSAEDFWRALHDGVRRDGQQLYPAMP